MVAPLAVIGALGTAGAGLFWLIMGGAGAYAILSNTTTIVWIVGGIIGLFIIKKLVR